MDKSPPSHDELKLRDMLRHLPQHEVPDDLTDLIMKRIAENNQGTLTRLIRRLNRPFSLSVSPIYACGIVVLVCGAFWFGWLSREMLPGRQEIPAALTSQTGTPVNAEAAYLVGRGLLAADRDNQALDLLQQASLLEPENPEYAYWEGLGYWATGNRTLEQKSYLRGLSFAPDSLPLLVNLGHSYLSQKQYESALDVYQAALQLAPGIDAARYNSGLIYRKLNRVQDEIETWKLFLKTHRTGRWAFRAVERLNDYGNFSFRSYQIGARKVILSPEILRDDTLPEQSRIAELAPVAAILEKNPGITTEVVVFVEHDLESAREIAHDIKRLIGKSSSSKIDDRVKLSWFDKPEIIRVREDKTFKRGEGVLLFGSPANEISKEVSI